MRGDILHVAHIFIAPFNLEGTHARVDQRAQVGGLVVILHREQVFFKCHHAALVVFQGIRQTAGLRAVAAVGAAARLRVGNIALAGIGHAQRAVDEEFNRRVCRLVNIADLIQVQLARQNDLRKTDVGEELRLLYRADITLGTGVQFNGRNIQLQHAHILNDQGIHPGLIEIGNQTLRRLQLIIMKNGVQGNEHLRPETVGERHQLSNIAQAVAGVMAGTEARAANVDGICAMKDRFTGNGGVTGRA
ncbi:Uncharacterised protein [Klebsiella pneumoniae]|nr:Uncharacterised protein [Klebsiella pneumoniae]